MSKFEPAVEELTSFFFDFYNETINNAAKYNKAKNVHKYFGGSRRDMHLIVSDDGIGMNEQQKAGNGLHNIRQLATELKGTCNIISSPGNGVTVTVVIPVSQLG
jgi:signal transduction histidine kinase